jgi:hypothetical protein
MFSVPTYRIRAHLQGVKRSQKEREKARNRNPLHFKRTEGEIRLSQNFDDDLVVINCRVILNDLSPERIFVFSEKPIAVGQAVSLTIQDPKRLFFIGRVVSCKSLPVHRGIVSSHKYEYRIAIRFEFANAKEKHAMQVTYFDLLKNYLSQAG